MPLINCPECGKEISDKADFCPSCGFPLRRDSVGNQKQNDLMHHGFEGNNTFAQRGNGYNFGARTNTVVIKQQKKRSGYATASLILGILGLLLSCVIVGIIPAILGIIFSALALSDKNNKRGSAIAGLICSLIAIFIFILVIFSVFNTENKDSNNGDENQIVESSDSGENENGSEAYESEELFKNSCQEFDYNTIARKPEDYVGQNFYVYVKVSSVVSSSSLFSSYDKYYKAYTDDGRGIYFDHMIYLMDYRDSQMDGYFNILEDDVIKVYGTFNGMVETKNHLNNTKGEEIGLDIYYAEIIE